MYVMNVFIGRLTPNVERAVYSAAAVKALRSLTTIHELLGSVRAATSNQRDCTQQTIGFSDLYGFFFHVSKLSFDALDRYNHHVNSSQRCLYTP